MRNQGLRVKALPSRVCSGSYLCNLENVTAEGLYKKIQSAKARNVLAIVGNNQMSMKRAMGGLKAVVRKHNKASNVYPYPDGPYRLRIGSLPWSHSAKLYRIRLERI